MRRHNLIELGGLMIKAKLDKLTNDRAVIYGAPLKAGDYE